MKTQSKTVNILLLGMTDW